MNKLLLPAIVFLALISRSAMADPVSYNITRIPALNAGGSSAAYAVSENGMVVGWTRDGSQYEQAIQWVMGTTTGLGRIGDNPLYVSKALSIDGGVIVGYSEYNGYGTKVVVWDKDGMHDLGHDGAQSAGRANAVNSSGMVVGNYGNGAGAFVAQNLEVSLISPPLRLV
jgi:uncharacterized membrane protein